MPLLKTPEWDEERKRRTLTLTITRDCNLRCRYCYEKHDQRIKEWDAPGGGYGGH